MRIVTLLSLLMLSGCASMLTAISTADVVSDYSLQEKHQQIT